MSGMTWLLVRGAVLRWVLLGLRLTTVRLAGVTLLTLLGRRVARWLLRVPGRRLSLGRVAVLRLRRTVRRLLRLAVGRLR